MKSIIIFLIIYNAINTNAQSSVKPTIGVNYSHEIDWNFYRLFTNKIDLSGGIRIKEHMFFNVALGVALGEKKDHMSLQIRSLTNSIGIDYRILKPNRIFSPMIGANFGYEITSNAGGKFVSIEYNGMVDKDNIYADPKFIYNKNLYFGRVKMLVDMEYKNISLRTGLNFNFSSFDETKFVSGFPNYDEGSQTNVRYLNMGIEAGMLYTFPMKKRAAKKALE